MLGVLRAALPGAAFAQSSGTLVSLWAFDETSGAGGVFDDLGPAELPMSIVGSWPDLTTDSIVQGVGGTSAYTDGSAYATIPAGQAAHALSALTLSFYYQRHSAAAKQVLVAAGDGTQAGDFSIEVLANGRLRGYHAGQDGVLRFFGDGAGITGTSLQVGTAHRIDLSLGPQGARIYLDGAELAAAAIPANVNGWNNARVKYLGVFPDGVGAPAVGAFDRFRLWDRQLANAEIALLEPAQSTTLPGGSQAGPAPLVPSLAEWLPSDESDPTVTKYVSNQNRGNGSGSSPSNAQEVQAALNGASAGAVLLAVCQTPGTIEFWNYPNGLSFPNGSSTSNRVTLQARNGDGVVLSRGEDFAGARTPNSGFWTQSGLSQTDKDNKIWKSVSTFSGGQEDMAGWWIEFGYPMQLVPTANLTEFKAPYGSADSPANYGMPCLFKDSSGVLWVRMQKPHPAKFSRDNKWSTSLWPGHPEAVNNGQLNYPLSENPNDYSIYVTRLAAVSQAFKFPAGGGHIKIGPGINSMGFRVCLDRNASDIVLDRSTHWVGQWFIMGSRSGEEINDYFLNRVRCTDGLKNHGAILEWKFGGHLEGYRSICFNEFDNNTLHGVYWKDCTIAGFHELFTNNQHGGKIRFRNCTIDHLWDDGFQGRDSLNRIEVGYCFFLSSDLGGMGESGPDGASMNPGEWYIHHNVFDDRCEKVDHWRAQPHPKDVWTSHSPDGNNPRLFYNNLMLYGPDKENEEGIGWEHSPQGLTEPQANNTLVGAQYTHQVFNNIICRLYIEGTKRYDPVVTNPDEHYGNINLNRTDFVGCAANRYSASHSNELMDYNLYYRPASMTTDPKFKTFMRGQGQTRYTFTSLGAWYAHAEFAHSKLSGTYRSAYTPGWEGNSTETKPTMGTIDDFPNSRLTGYRPAASSEVTTAASGSLNGRNWWTTPPSWGEDYFPWNDGAMTLEPDAFKGPLDPNGSTMPVGVQKP